MQPPFDKIEWHRPWLEPFRSLGLPVAASAVWRNALNDMAARLAIKNHRGLQVQFVSQSELQAGMAYEHFISESGCVPTRDNLHDFFNALVWLVYPNIKRELNALQAAEITRLQPLRDASASSVRGPKRDAATLFDENAAIVVVRSGQAGKLITARLRQHHWHDPFCKYRREFACHCSVLLFGHALIEKLVAPYKAITAHAVVIDSDSRYFESNATSAIPQIDRMLAAQLRQDSLAKSLFTPLPVLGIPGWHDVQDVSFYADTDVFRPKRLDR